MAGWGAVGLIYGAWIAATAIVRGPTMPARASLALAAVAYGLLCGWAATFEALWIHLVAPGAALLCGYWLPARLFGIPQPWLEALLRRQDRWLFDAVDLDRRLAHVPRWTLELLELFYASVYPIVGIGATMMAVAGRDQVIAYWTLVLASGLGCYAALPWLRSRPPRTLEPPGALARRAPAARRLNLVILDTASVQANTIPSGHIAAALAAALAVFPVSSAGGSLLLVVAVLIAAAAIAGRYHYSLDCAAGAAIAIVVWRLLS